MNMNIACTDKMVVPEVRAVLQHYGVARVSLDGPSVGSPMVWVMVDVGLGQDKERDLRRAIAQIPGASIRS